MTGLDEEDDLVYWQRKRDEEGEYQADMEKEKRQEQDPREVLEDIKQMEIKETVSSKSWKKNKPSLLKSIKNGMRRKQNGSHKHI